MTCYEYLRFLTHHKNFLHPIKSSLHMGKEKKGVHEAGNVQTHLSFYFFSSLMHSLHYFFFDKKERSDIKI